MSKKGACFTAIQEGGGGRCTNEWSEDKRKLKFARAARDSYNIHTDYFVRLCSLMLVQGHIVVSDKQKGLWSTFVTGDTEESAGQANRYILVLIFFLNYR